MSDTPRHIALLLPDLAPGGAERVMLLLAREFARRGHRATLLLLRAEGALLGELPAGVELVDLGARAGALGRLGLALSAIGRLTAWLRRERPQALLSAITGTNLVALSAHLLTRGQTRTVITQAAALPLRPRSLRQRLMRLLYPRADHVIALTPQMSARLIHAFGVPAAKIACIPNPVDAEHVRRMGEAALDHPWLAAPGFKVIVSAGRLVPEKDYATLLRAFALLAGRDDLRLIIVGEGPLRPQLESLAAQLAIADRVALPGFDLNPWRWMARADLYVLSSVSEGQPISLIEAFALNLPAIATVYDPSVLALAERHPLDCVECRNPAALARAIAAALARPRRGSRLVAPDHDRSVAEYLRLLA